MDWLFTNPIASQVIGIGVAAACGYLGAQVKRLSARDAALYEGMKAVLRRELVDDFEAYVVEGHPMSIERKREVDECYHAYRELGGNGTGAQMYEKICDVKIQLLKEDA